MAGSNGVTYVNKVEIGTNQFDINDSRIKLTVTGASNIGDTLCISDVEMVNDQVEAVEMSNVKMTTDTVPVANDKNYVTTAEKTDWNSKQAGLSDSNKLNPAYVDTSGDDYKFVTQADITNWNSKQGLLTAGANIDITNGVISGAYPNAAAPSGADPGHSGLMTSTDKGLVSLLTYRWKRNNVEDFILTTTTGESGTDPEIVGVWYPDPDPDPTTNTGLYHQTLLVDGMTADYNPTIIMVYPDATSGVSDLEAVTVQIQKNMSYISKIITDNGKIVAYASKLPEKPEEGVYDHAAVFKLIGV